MRKGIYYALIILIIILAVLTPWVDGILFKKKYMEFINIINEDNRAKIDVLKYHQGWLHSDAKLHIIINTNAFADFPNLHPVSITRPIQINLSKPVNFIIIQHISHGPLVFNRILHKFEVGYANIQSSLFLSDESNTTKPHSGFLKIASLAKFDGDWQGQIYIPTISFFHPEFGSMNWNGLYGDYKLTIHHQQLKHILVNIMLGPLSFSDKSKVPLINSLNIQPIKYQYDALHEKSGLWTGNAILSTKDITIKNNDGTSIDVDDLSINSTFTASARTFYNSNLSFNINHLVIPNQIFSHFKKVNIVLSANSFSAQGLLDYINFIKSMTPEAIKSIDLNKIETLLVHAIIPTSSFYIEISSNTSLGAISIRSKTTWDPNFPDPDSFDDVINHTNTEIEIKASSPIVTEFLLRYSDKLTNDNFDKNNVLKQITIPAPSTNITKIEQMIHDMVLVGYLTKEGDNYLTTITINNGVLKINGRLPIPKRRPAENYPVPSK